MGVKNIHVVLIAVSILLSFGFGLWLIAHSFTAWGCLSFAITVALLIYCVDFIRKMKVL